MIETFLALRRFSVHATDGEIGRVVDLFFDDETWTVRYFVVETAGLRHKRRVLISPIAVTGLNEADRRLAVDLTCDQVERSPDVDTETPDSLSRDRELNYRDSFSWPSYWVDTYLEAYDQYPRLAAASEAVRTGREPRKERLLAEPPKAGPHLRSARDVLGYTVIATDGPAGRVEDLQVDSDGWAVRWLVVDAKQAPNPNRVLIGPDEVSDVKWQMSSMHVRMTRRQIGALPAASE